jgi:hypothetical protein
MNRIYCEKEKEIVEALRCGTLNAELEEHASGCAICSDTAAVSQFLQANRTAAPVLPDADFLWWKGQLAGKQMAVERATRSINLVRRISYLCATAAAVWLIFSPGYLRSIASSFPKNEIWSASVLGESALLMSVAALLFAVLGSLYLARAEE